MTDHERAMRYVACEGSATRSKRVGAFPEGVGGYAIGGHGARLQTSDGRELIDWVGSLGATPLGYGRISQKLSATVDADCLYLNPLYSLPHVLEGQVAERLCTEVVPWAEQIKFVKTGSEACSGAIRIARAATGRNAILKIEGHYHGWHDWAVEDTDDHPGVPTSEQGDEYLITTIPHDEVLKELTLKRGRMRWAQRYAAIILEPATRNWVPTSAWLQQLVDVAHQSGVLVIFDEMLMGGRLALGGGSEYFGVTPDLATYGKALGGGVPFAFIAGKRDLMQHATYISGTYSGDVLGLAACDAVLNIYRDEKPIERLWGAGRMAQRWFGKTTGLPPFFAVDLPPARMGGIVQSCASDGVLFHPTMVMPSAAFTEADMVKSQQAVAKAFQSETTAGFGQSMRT